MVKYTYKWESPTRHSKEYLNINRHKARRNNIMNMYEALMITGRLEIIFQGEGQILNEVVRLQKSISEKDYAGCAISLGRLGEMTKKCKLDDSKSLESLSEFVINKEEVPKIVDTTIEDLKFSVRTFNCLKRSGFSTIGDLLKLNGEELCKIRNLGQKSFKEILAKLKELGFGEFVEKVEKEVLELRHPQQNSEES